LPVAVSINILRQVEGGSAVADVCRQMGVSEATFDIWKKKYAHLGVNELRQLRSLEDENARLKRLVADHSLDKHILTEALRKNVWSAPDLQAVPHRGPVRVNVSGLLMEHVDSWPRWEDARFRPD
jgi:putative transposase